MDADAGTAVQQGLVSIKMAMRPHPRLYQFHGLTTSTIHRNKGLMILGSVISLQHGS